MDVVDTERTKLLANALNTASTTCFTVGIATPIAGYLYNVGGLRATIDISTLVLGIVGWTAAAVVLHLRARAILGKLGR